MEVNFLNKELLKLYETGKSKKYRLAANVIQGFFEVVAILIASTDIMDLWKEPSLNFEKLQGFKKRYSLRITRKYKLEVEIEWENKEKTIGNIGIDEISNHYR